MQRGKVIVFHPRGYGFVESAEDAKSVFFHIKQIEGQIVPKPGDTLEFEAAPDAQGRMTVSHARILRVSNGR